MKTMRKIGIIVFGVVCTLSLFAAPARRGWFPRTLADGTVVQVQQIGDEYYHFMVTQDGKMVTESEQGLVISDEPVPTPAQVAARRAQRAPQATGTKSLAPRGLVILAAFKDVPYQATNDNAGMWDMMNKSGYNYQGATGSARDYFIAQSDSAYMPVFDVVGPVTLPQKRAYYGGNTSSKDGSDANRRQMVIDACTLVDDEVNFALYDNDKNGKVDFIYIVYAGIGENDKNSVSEAIWAHSWDVSSLNCYLDGKKLAKYACSGEVDGPTGNRNGIGVICHEFGHVIGLPDYYDTEYSTNYNNWLTPNYWSTMDQGCYNNGAMTPPNYSIFDKYFMGWATPVILPKDKQHYVRMGTNCKNAYQITGGTSLKPYATPDTVYYIENRQQTGWDAALPSHGMIVWQVVYDQSAWSNNKPNNTAYQPRYTIIPAVSGPIGAFDGSAATNPFPGAGNITSYTPFAGCVLSDIIEENGKINFKYNGGKSVCEYLVMSENCVVSSEEGTLSAGQILTLTITPDSGYSLDPECWAVEMGEVNPLLEYGIDYTYDAETGAFRLENVTDDVTIIVEAIEDAGTGIETVESQKTKVESRKVLRNGQLFILRGNKQYNAQGIEIQ